MGNTELALSILVSKVSLITLFYECSSHCFDLFSLDTNLNFFSIETQTNSSYLNISNAFLRSWTKLGIQICILDLGGKSQTTCANCLVWP